jgi:hypothetical protein
MSPGPNSSSQRSLRFFRGGLLDTGDNLLLQVDAWALLATHATYYDRSRTMKVCGAHARWRCRPKDRQTGN